MFSSCPEKLYLKTTPLSCTEISSSLLPVLCSALRLSLSRKAGGKEHSSYRKAFQSQVLGGKRCFNKPFIPSSCEGTWTNNPICQSPGVPPKVLLKATADIDWVLLVPVPEGTIPVADTTLSPPTTALAARLLPISWDSCHRGKVGTDSGKLAIRHHFPNIRCDSNECKHSLLTNISAALIKNWLLSWQADSSEALQIHDSNLGQTLQPGIRETLAHQG